MWLLSRRVVVLIKYYIVVCIGIYSVCASQLRYGVMVWVIMKHRVGVFQCREMNQLLC
jgi:hypothetical protein